MRILLALSLALLAAAIYSSTSAHPVAAHPVAPHSISPSSALTATLNFSPGQLASPERANHAGRLAAGYPGPNRGNPTAWPQQEEIDRDCALQVLGRIPGGLRDLSRKERQLVKELCVISLSDPLETISAGFDLRGIRDANSGGGPDPELENRLDEINRYWSGKLEILNSDWSEDLGYLQQERHDLELFWEQELALAEESWNQDLRDIAHFLYTREDDWSNELGQIDRRVAVIVGPSRERGLLLRKRSVLVNQIESERLELEQELDLRQLSIDEERFFLQQEIDQSLGQLDQQIIDKERWWGEAQDELDLERSRELQRAEQEWYQFVASDRPEHFDGATKGGEPSFTLEPEPVIVDRIMVPTPVNTDLNTPVRTEYVPTPVPQVESIEPQVEPTELAVLDSQDEQRQRGFFVNGQSSLTGSPLGGTLEPATLALLGILITLGTAAMTLVRGR